MKPLRFLLTGLFSAALLCLPAVPLLTDKSQTRMGGVAAAQEPVDISYFYDELAPYGQWVWHPRFSYVWLPQEVSEDWRPYAVGQWFYTDEYGWYWHSEEPFAWAVYHYGRWGYDPDYGWFWVPGDVWAPAWVTWRYGDSYAGWAPIAPHRAGYAYGVPAYYEPPVAEAWVFVEPEYLFVENIYDYAVPVPEINVVFLQTTTIYHPEFHGDVIFNAGIPYRHLESILNRPVPIYEVVEVQVPHDGRAWRDRGQKALPRFAPRLDKSAPHRPPKQFAQTPFEASPKARLRSAVRETPQGIGPSASKLKPIAKEVGPSGFNPKGKAAGPFERGGPPGGREPKGPKGFTTERSGPRDLGGPRRPSAAGIERDRDWDRRAAKQRGPGEGPKANATDRGGPKAAAKGWDRDGGPKAAKDRGRDGGAKDRGGPKAAPKERDRDGGPKAARDRGWDGGPKAAAKDRGGAKAAEKERDRDGGPKAARDRGRT